MSTIYVVTLYEHYEKRMVVAAFHRESDAEALAERLNAAARNNYSAEVHAPPVNPTDAVASVWLLYLDRDGALARKLTCCPPQRQRPEYPAGIGPIQYAVYCPDHGQPMCVSVRAETLESALAIGRDAVTKAVAAGVWGDNDATGKLLGATDETGDDFEEQA